MKTQVKLVFSVPLSELDFDIDLMEGFKGFLRFQGKPITKEIEEAMNDRHYGHSTDGKTKSQLLRGTLLTYSHYLDRDADKEQYYNNTMQSLINHFEGKIKEIIGSKYGK